MPTQRRKAPWPDFNGRDIHEGDTIQHPSGESGTVIYRPDNGPTIHDKWLVEYHSEWKDIPSRLCLQIGDRGQAIVV